MGEIQVKFLEKEYLFPQEIKDYVFYCQKFQKVNDNFLTVLAKRVKDGWYDYPDKEFEELFREAGKEVITLLSQDKIYDVTISELVDQNAGYISFQNITKDGFEKYKNIYVEATEEFRRGYEKAQMIASSKVTGSGLTLYSSSLLAHMTFAALESNTVKKQAAKADKEYREAMAVLSKKNQTVQEKKKTDFLYNELYPAYFGIVGEFVSELLEKYLNILYKHSVYDYSKVKSYNLQKSTELLDNLDIVDDKKEVLALAFENCPYNNGVYQKVIDLGFMDLDSFRTIQILGKEEDAINCIQTYCLSRFNDTDILNCYISILAVAKKVDEKTVWYELYSDKIDGINNHYQGMKKALTSDANMVEWIRMNICSSVDKLLQMDENEIMDCVDRVTQRISVNDLSIYLEKGLVSLQDIRLEDSNSEKLDQINYEYCSVFHRRINRCIFDLKEKMDEEEKKKIFEQERKKELEQENRIKRHKKIKRLTYICVFAVLFLVCAVQIFRYTTMNIESNEEKIAKGAELLGQEYKNGEIKVTPEYDAYLKDVKLFGYDGEINHGLTDGSNDKIDVMDWTSKEECNKEDLKQIISELEIIYGEYYEKNDSYYGNMDESYQWRNVGKYKWVICGITSEGKLLIRWII